MALIALISFQFPKKDFCDVLQHTNIMRYSLHFFSLHLINFKGVIGVPVAMTKIPFETLRAIQILLKFRQ